MQRKRDALFKQIASTSTGYKLLHGNRFDSIAMNNSNSKFIEFDSFQVQLRAFHPLNPIGAMDRPNRFIDSL